VTPSEIAVIKAQVVEAREYVSLDQQMNGKVRRNERVAALCTAIETLLQVVETSNTTS
jgi:hypothetical protein